MTSSLQVAAICYRMAGCHVEFLLVKTTGGYWTFPKGNIGAKASAVESAAREACEEAGARGVIDQRPLGAYLYRKPRRQKAPPITITAYLLEVQSQEIPKEAKRCPTWFTQDAAKAALGQHRSRDDADAMEKVIDLAIERLRVQGIEHIVK